MKQTSLLKTMLLLCCLLVGGSAWAADPVTIASFTVDSHEGWTINADGNGSTISYYLLTASDKSIVSPSIDWSGYKNVTVKVKARKYGGPSASQLVISVSQGSTDLTTFSPTSTSLKDYGPTAITPTGTGSLTICCKAASSNRGSGVSEILIQGEEVSSDADSEAAFANSEVSIDLKDITSYKQTATTAEGYTGIVTYSMTENTAGATINASTGEVTPTKAGSVTVKASAEKVAGSWTASSATYTLTVSDSRPYAGIYWDVKNTEIELDATSGYTVPSLVNPNSLTGITYEITGTAGLVSESAGVLSVDTSIKGEASVKAIYAGGTHKPSTVTCTIAVYDPTEKGTKYNPYSVADIIALNPTSTTVIKSSVYVTGYIIGGCNSSTGELVNSNVNFDTNLALADTPNETEDYISAQLPSGDIRTALNVKSAGHPYYIGCGKVLMKGDVALYCKKPGVKNVSSGELIGQSIKVTSAGLSTYCTDVNLAFDGSLEAYIAKEEAGAVKLYQVTNVPANTGVLLRAPGIAADTYFDVLTTESADDVKDNIFQQGNDAAVATSAGGKYNWILSKKSGVVGFYHANGNNVAKNRAYLQTAAASARINLDFDDATAIEAVKAQNGENGQFFNLAGQRVAQPTKGLYIVNGKKVIIK